MDRNDIQNLQESDDVQESKDDDTSFGEAGIKALRKERQRVKELEAKLREIEDSQKSSSSSDDSDTITLREQLSFLTNSNAELQSKVRLQKEEYESQLAEKNKQIENYEIKGAFEKVSAAAGLDSRYSGLYYASVRPDLSVVDGKVVHRSGVELSEWIDTNKLNYPDLFKANNPGGVNARGGGASVKGKSRVSRSDTSSFFKNLDLIAKGEVQVDD